MPIDWKDPTVKDRLLAAIIASFDNKTNCARVAQLFGEGATYNAIENFLRAPKKEAIKLKESVGEAAASPTRAPRTPKKSDGVKTGRVTKKKSDKGSPVKKEYLFDENNWMDQSGGEADAAATMDDYA